MYYIYLTESNLCDSWFTIYGRGFNVNFRRMMLYYSDSGQVKFKNLRRVSNELHDNDAMAKRMKNYMRGKAKDHERYTELKSFVINEMNEDLNDHRIKFDLQFFKH